MRIYLLCFLLLFSMSCGGNKKKAVVSSIQENTVSGKEKSFSADSAYLHIANQVAFGPRVPNTKAHAMCASYLSDQLKGYGAEVTIQEAQVAAYDGTLLNIKNIIGSYAPDKKDRVLLFAHWDTRPFADHDPLSKNHHTPIDGADDGASAVGVLLEIARVINENPPSVGVDIIFFDAEDYGIPEFENKTSTNESWCLGSQYWGKNPHIHNYKANFGILLDMVGSKDAVFYKEHTSMSYAAPIVNKVWKSARKLGYGKYFINGQGGGITDDHYYVNRYRDIPSIDIINYDPESEKGFATHWHTLKDNMDAISKETLKAVGETVLYVLYNEK